MNAPKKKLYTIQPSSGALDATTSFAVKPNKPSNGNDVLNGSNKSEKIDGLSGNDSIMGLAGNDTLMGSAGNDTLNGGVGNDKLTGSTGTDNLIGDAGNDYLDGGSENDMLDGGADNDTLNGGTGNDTMTGGAGNDVYFVDAVGDKIIEPDTSPAGGKDTVNSGINFSVSTIAGIENLLLTGTGNFSGTGNSLNNAITGNKGNNSLSGGIGNDTLDGSAGNDTLDGGTGIDKLIGGTGNDTYVVSNTEDRIIEQKNGGDRDTISTGGNFTLPDNIEVLTLTGTLDSNGSGNKLSNTLNGNSGKNTLSGDQGNDTLLGNAGDDTLDGGTGSNVLDGGDGIDTVVLSGPQSQYQLTEDTADHSIRIKDVGSKGGTNNELRHVEKLEFADSTLDISNGLQNNLSLTVADVSGAEGNTGSKSLVFKLSLSAAPNSPVTINYKTVDGDAFAGEDYTANQGTVTFAKGETSKTVSVDVLGDTRVESDEQFSLQLTLPDNVSMKDNEARATIVNDDKPTLNITDTTLDEGGDGDTTDALVAVTLSDAIDQEVTVSYTTVNGTAKDSSDYSFTGGVLTFAPGETSQFIKVPVIGDSTAENNETFRVHLSSPTNAQLSSTVDGTVTITDDDFVTPNISIDPSLTVFEGNSGSSNADFTVSLSEKSTVPVNVDYSTTHGTALDGSDYTTSNGTLTFAPGETRQTIHIPVLGDTEVESDETVNLALFNPKNGSLATDIPSTLIISNDDQYTLDIEPTIKITEGNAGDTATAEVIVSLSAASNQNVMVDYATADGTANSNSDYTETTGTLIFGPGETSKTISVPLIGDNTVESDETFNLMLSNASSGVLIANDSSTVTISNDDQENNKPTGEVTISGTAMQGKTLTVSNSLVDADGLGVIAYQWNADGKPITGATTESYTLTQTDIGKVISVVAGYTDQLGNDESVSSTGTGKVIAEQEDYLSFDGSAQYVVGVDGNLPLGNTPRTLDVWVRDLQTSTSENLGGSLVQYGSIDPELHDPRIIAPGTNFNLLVNKNNGSIWFDGRGFTISSDNSINDGLWHKLTVTFGNNDLRLYIDGNLEASSLAGKNVYAFYPFEINTTTEYNDKLFIGRSLVLDPSDPSRQQFQGDIKAVDMYSRVLTASEIANQDLPTGSENGLVSFYDFSKVDISAGTITDQTDGTTTLSLIGFEQNPQTDLLFN